VGAAKEPGRVAHAEAAMGEAKQGAVSVGGEFVAHHTVLDDRLLPFVFEHIGWVPHEYAARHPLAFGWQWWARRDHLDHPAFAGVDRRLSEPLFAFVGIGDGRPDDVDRKGQRRSKFSTARSAATVSPPL